MKQRVFWLGVFIIFFYAFISWYRIVSTSAPDFSVYYEAAKRLLGGGVLYGENVGFTGFSYPPQTALLFIPFTVLPFTVAQTIWVTVSFLCVLVLGGESMELLGKFRQLGKLGSLGTLGRVGVISSLIFLSFPTKFTLGMGQVNLISLSILCFGLIAIQKKQQWWGGILIGLAILLKPQSVILLIPFILLGRFREILGSLGVLGVVTLWVVLLFGWKPFESYVHTELPMLLGFSGRDIYYNQSLSSFFSRVLPAFPAQILSNIGSLGILGGGVWMVIKKRLPVLEAVLFFIPIFLLIQPITWQHHGVYVLPSLLTLWFLVKGTVQKGFVVLAYLLISMNIPHPEWFTSVWLLRATLLSHMFWGMVLVFGMWITVLSTLKERVRS